MLAEGPAPGDDPLGVASQGGAEAEDEELAATAAWDDAFASGPKNQFSA